MPSKTLELHIWGRESEVALIDPESRACVWLLFLHLTPFNTQFSVITSCNTNLADTRKLPLLVVKNGNEIMKHEGFYSIVEFVSTLHPADLKFIPNTRMNSTELLVNLTLTKYIQDTFHYINQYNLYVNTRNYELYTRKMFSSLLPFPMYYNQPLKFHTHACDQVKVVGLSSSLAGFLGLSGGVPDTDFDEEDESNTVAISALHEKVLLAKDKDRTLLRESRMTIRCLNLLDGYVSHVMALFKELNPDSPVEFAHLFRPAKISASELLLYSYIYSMTHDVLPDRFVWKYLSEKFPPFARFSATITEALNESIVKDHFRAARDAEIPSLWNELKFMAPSLK
ncbi:hypothetical protein PUMCH_003996 [Australozyma saopauloensis]|uniref:Mitochondrial outer membrane transport complex Sam37/metaxin N-terminal domain-containing protein n=1 Tax=Australozyma saopauloensis TaxID=291208 RepID=A0AAX4HFH7_9ASCO|nr:hypothetical protein PUMCH_003996 [[Candida] saopauloensis]